MSPETSSEASAEVTAGEVTTLLQRWRAGDDDALERLTPLVYDELHRLAHAYMRREHAADLLQTTALVNEAYLRLVGLDVRWQGRSHFFAICAQLMRRILVDHARRRRAEKRGGPLPPLRLGDLEIPAERADHLVALDDALRDLESVDVRKCEALVMHYFGGMTALEIGDALGVSQRTVERDLRLARAWVADAMTTR
ncbi:MAG: ECF-type sigma factor [Acidobacteriota bacterium]